MTGLSNNFTLYLLVWLQNTNNTLLLRILRLCFHLDCIERLTFVEDDGYKLTAQSSFG